MKILHDIPNKQINFLDERFYTRDNVHFFPSVTTVLDVYPKGYGYIQWLKDLGSNAEQVMKRAGEQGTAVHNAIDKYLNGEELIWSNDLGEARYTIDVWLMILKFVEFWTTYKPELIVNEQNYVSEILGFGGTMDLVCRINNVVWLIDYKSGNGIYKSFEFQLAAYEKLWTELSPEIKIQRRGVMHLRATTRGADKSGKTIQGKGWKLHEFDHTHEGAFNIFKHAQALWREENPNPVPKNMIYPDRIKLEVVKD